MYFNEKEDTNIDKEFKNNNSFDFYKYKKPIMIGGIILIAIILLIVIIIIFNNRTVYYLTLNGESKINYYQGSSYIDPGYIARDNHGNNLTRRVEVIGNVNSEVIGEYNITYKLGNKTIKRTVNIVEKPVIAAYIHLNEGDQISISEGSSYVDPGYQVFSYNHNDNLESKVTVTGTVDTSKKGDYILTYSVVTDDGVTITAKRTVTVY